MYFGILYIFFKIWSKLKIYIIYNTWYDFTCKFKDLRLSNYINIMIMCMIQL